MTTNPPGWYDDGHGAMRWWDGTRWTEHSAEPDADVSPAPTEAEIVEGAESSTHPEPAMVAAPSDATPQPDRATRPASPAQQHPTDAGGPVEGDPHGVQPDAHAGGAFAAATGPRTRSKLWIVWVILGTVLLGIVIAAAVLIPLALMSTANSGGQTDDERAAVATVGAYDDAWQQGDCDSFNAVTTEDFRATNGFGDCATLQSQSAAFGEVFEDYKVNVTDVETVGDEIIVTTRETYTALVDESGNPIEPLPGETVYHYTLVEADGDWVVTQLTYETE
jgi:hypothetical protein